MKILIIGSVASGKTSLARKLENKLNIKYFEIDSIVHNDIKKIKRTNEEQKEIIDRINNDNKEWIIEGTLRKNLDYLLDYADKIIYLNIDVKTRKRRIIKRFIKQRLKLERCNYNPDIEMLKLMYKWTNEFEKNKSEFENKIEKYSDKLIKITNGKEIEKIEL
jgi:adenylate kinase family enzyme